MKFYCNQQELNRALNIVSKAITVRTTIPVLKGILIIAEDNHLILRASDLDMSIETKIDAVVEENGNVVANSKLFVEIIRKLPNGNIYMEKVGENNVNIKTDSSEFQIVGQSGENFPVMNIVEENANKLSIEKEILKNMIRRTNFSASIDESKGVLVGELIEINQNDIRMISVDGFRISVYKEDMKNENLNDIIIHAKTLSEVLKLLSESDIDEDVELIIGSKEALILLDKTKVSIKLMEGEFIKYKDILPKDCNTRMKVDRKFLMQSIERASLMAKEGKNNLIKCTIDGNLLTINSRSDEGSVKEELIVKKEGDNIEIGFNSKYILDVLKVLDDEEISIEFKNSLAPCSIKPVKGDNYEYLILPVRIP